MFLSQRKNGYFFIQFFDPKLNKVLRVSTGTKKKAQAIKYLANFQQKTQNKSELPAKILLRVIKG